MPTTQNERFKLCGGLKTYFTDNPAMEVPLITEITTHTKPPRLVVVFTALLVFAYLLQARSPLRLNTDSVVLLSIGASVADGHGFLYRGEATHFPPGYPAMVALLDRLGLASSWSFILLNCAFLGVSLVACYLFCRNPLGLAPSASAGACCMVMLSFVLVKHVTIPVSDVAFLGLFTLVLLLLSRSRDEAGYVRWSWLVWAVLLAAEVLPNVETVLGVI